MKRYYKLLTVFMTVVVLIYLIFSNSVVVYAHGGGGTVDDDEAFTYDSITGYSMVDDTTIPDGQHFFYRYDSGKAWYCTFQDALAMCANKSYGMSFSPEVLRALANGFMSYASQYTGGIPFSNRAVMKGNSIVGYALNSLTGCKIVNPTENVTGSVDSEVNNFIFIYIQDYIDTNYTIPDYVSIKPMTRDYVAALLPVNVTKYSDKIALLEEDNWILGLNRRTSSPIYDLQNVQGYTYIYNSINTDCGFYAFNVTEYNTFCNTFAIPFSNPSFDMVRMLSQNYYSDLRAYVFDGTTLQSSVPLTSIRFSTNETTQTNNTFYIIQGGSALSVLIGKPFTLYKNADVFTQIKNHTYAPTYNTSNETNNYDSTSTTNNYDFSSNDMNNSSTTNETIYNEQSENYTDNSYYNSENNYYIDNSQVQNNNTTIINNYYGDNNGGGGNGGGSDDDDDDLIWTALLKAIADFFKKIGELIATVLTGIVTILTSILDAIATIVSDFTGITDFLGQIFAWLPGEIITLMTLGLTTALFAAFLTWFKK